MLTDEQQPTQAHRSRVLTWRLTEESFVLTTIGADGLDRGEVAVVLLQLVVQPRRSPLSSPPPAGLDCAAAEVSARWGGGMVFSAGAVSGERVNRG